MNCAKMVWLILVAMGLHIIFAITTGKQTVAPEHTMIPPFHHPVIDTPFERSKIQNNFKINIFSFQGCLYQYGLYPVGEGCQTTFYKVSGFNLFQQILEFFRVICFYDQNVGISMPADFPTRPENFSRILSRGHNILQELLPEFRSEIQMTSAIIIM